MKKKKIYISILPGFYCTNIVMETGLGSALKDTEQVGGERGWTEPPKKPPRYLKVSQLSVLPLWGKATASISHH